jgi:hypothetical protein
VVGVVVSLLLLEHSVEEVLGYPPLRLDDVVVPQIVDMDDVVEHGGAVVHGNHPVA